MDIGMVRSRFTGAGPTPPQDAPFDRSAGAAAWAPGPPDGKINAIDVEPRARLVHARLPVAASSAPSTSPASISHSTVLPKEGSGKVAHRMLAPLLRGSMRDARGRVLLERVCSDHMKQKVETSGICLRKHRRNVRRRRDRDFGRGPQGGRGELQGHRSRRSMRITRTSCATRCIRSASHVFAQYLCRQHGERGAGATPRADRVRATVRCWAQRHSASATRAHKTSAARDGRERTRRLHCRPRLLLRRRHGQDLNWRRLQVGEYGASASHRPVAAGELVRGAFAQRRDV